MERIAIKAGIRQDLISFFNGDFDLVDDVITLAMFRYLTRLSHSRLERRQERVKAPSSRMLTPTVIARLTQSITERHRKGLIKLGAGRIGIEVFCAVDSTTRSACGHVLADIRLDGNDEPLSLNETTEVVACALSSRAPISCRTFPGNIPDSRTLDVICADLDQAGLKNVILITGLGCDSLQNVKKDILQGRRMIMGVKTGQREACEALKSIAEFKDWPESMKIDAEERSYFEDFDIDYNVHGKGKSVKSAGRLRLRLHLDPIRRARELFQVNRDLTSQAEAPRKLIQNGSVLRSVDEAKRDNHRYELVQDETTGRLNSFERDEKKLATIARSSGFFSIMTRKLDFDSKRTFEFCRLRDEQGTRFQRMRSQMVNDRQRNWPEEGKTGKRSILLISLILGARARHVRGNASLMDAFASPMEALDATRSISRVGHATRVKEISPSAIFPPPPARATSFCMADTLSKKIRASRSVFWMAAKAKKPAALRQIWNLHLDAPCFMPFDGLFKRLIAAAEAGEPEAELLLYEYLMACPDPLTCRQGDPAKCLDSAAKKGHPQAVKLRKQTRRL